MSSADDTLILLTSTGERVGPCHAAGVDVTFPSPDVRWAWVLDARCEPYPDLPLTDVLARARNVRKRWVLVTSAMLDTHLAVVNRA